jgi:hypothetical protein
VSLAFKLDINYDSPNPRSVFYYGGSLLDGGVQDYKVNVLKNGNIDNDATPGLLSKELITSSVRGASQNSLDAEETLPRIADTTEEARGREQVSQESNDDEMDDPDNEDEYAKSSGGDVDGSGSRGDSSSFPSGIKDDKSVDQDMAFLNLLQQSHPT